MKNLLHFTRFAALVFFIAITVACSGQTNYYSKATGNLNLTTSWGTSTNGTGTNPTNFTAANHIFNIRNNAAPTISANWTVSGSGSYMVVGDGTNGCNFKIPTNFTCKGTIDVSANGTLTIANKTIPTLRTLNASSTVVFDGTAAQTIPAVTYGNLTYSGSNTGTMAGGCTIVGALSVTSGILELDQSNSPYTYNVGSMVVTTTQYVDFGSSNNGGANAAIMNLSGNLSQTGTGQITTVGEETNATINFTGTQTVQLAQATYLNFVVKNGSVVTLGGNFSFSGSGGYPASFEVALGGTLNCGTNDLLTSTINQSIFTLASGGNLITANTKGLGPNGSIQTLTNTFSNGANYTYDGSAAQVTGVFTTTPTASTVTNLTIDNTSATGVTLSQAESVMGVLTLTDGLLNTTSTNLITVTNGGSTTGASNSSFVNGPITKAGNQAFIFPVGVSGTGYVPIGMSAPSNTTDAFQAQYYRTSAAAWGPVTATDLNHVSFCDYWTLNRMAGTSALNVTGYWNANSPCGGTYVNDLATIALAHFNGTSWNAWGNDVVSGSVTNGSVTWNNVSNFSPFALGSESIFDPLPLTLVDFNAHWQTGQTVGLTWEIEDGVNTNHFDIQRSADGENWQTIGTLEASGASSLATDYSYTDATPIPTLDYYRLQLVDDAGNDTYSTVRVVSQSPDNGITIFPNPATDHINVSFGATGVSGPVSIRLMNMTGQVLLQKSVQQPAGETISLSVAGYPAGSYLVQVLGAGQVEKSSIVLVIK